MKKALKLSCLLIVILLVGTACSANKSAASSVQKFSLHNGTTFAMDKTGIMNLEAENGCSLVEKSPLLLRASGTFVGRDNAELFYAFDQDNALKQFHYLFDDATNEDYEHISNSLTAKYGAAHYSAAASTFLDIEAKWLPADGETCPIIWLGYTMPAGRGLDGIQMKKFALNVFGTLLYHYYNYDCDQYEQWLIRLKDGDAVLIDHSIIKVQSFQSTTPITKYSNLSNSTYEAITYTYLTKEEVNAIDEKANQVMSDL